MPRKFSRITLEVTGVRVERLRAISDADLLAEGVSELLRGQEARSFEPQQRLNAFAQKWGQLHGQGAFASDPWVWVVDFRKV